MAQGNLIIIRIRAAEAERFESMFRDEEATVWADLRDRGLLRYASLTRIAFGTEEREAKSGDYVAYGIYAEFEAMAGHTAHDDDPRFNEFLGRARKLQPSSPSVWGGEVIVTSSAER
jgi:hypothetical protein